MEKYTSVLKNLTWKAMCKHILDPSLNFSCHGLLSGSYLSLPQSMLAALNR